MSELAKTRTALNYAASPNAQRLLVGRIRGDSWLPVSDSQIRGASVLAAWSDEQFGFTQDRTGRDYRRRVWLDSGS